MSDSFVLCPKCGEEVEKRLLGYKDVYESYVCDNCLWFGSYEEVRKVSTEYLKEEGGYRK